MQSLFSLLQVSVPISIKGRIILEIIEGMAYLNQNSIIHKDLKPENILIDKDVHVKVLSYTNKTMVLQGL